MQGCFFVVAILQVVFVTRVGKDSMSMKTRWQEGSEQREMTSPLSLVISAFARVEDVRHTVTPQLSTEDNALLLIDLGKGHNALGATALAQVYRQLGDKPGLFSALASATWKIRPSSGSSSWGVVTLCSHSPADRSCGIPI